MRHGGAEFLRRPIRVSVPAWHGRTALQQIVGAARRNRPCRIYAPVGSHETLLAYLVRRLLENGANTSFVNRIADAAVPVDALIEDPSRRRARSIPLGAPHPLIAAPRDLFAPARAKFGGLRSQQRGAPAALGDALTAIARRRTGALARARRPDARDHQPADVPRHRRPLRGLPGPGEVERAFAAAARHAPAWAGQRAARRAHCLVAAAATLRKPRREAGRADLPRGRQDVAQRARRRARGRRFPALLRGRRSRDDFSNATHRPLGIVACISPWNFPIAIFTGQVAPRSPPAMR
jgi:RHH-type proline utilization regulon transcriptional repressor/proline dehydrogenase/delta 1-pyrroline-5-carboxylate dehydrogenase